MSTDTHTPAKEHVHVNDHAHAVAHASPLERTEEALANNPGGLNAPMIAFVGGVGIVLVFVIMVATQAWFYSQENRANELDGYTQPSRVIGDYKAAQRQRLDEVRWLDADKQRVSVPIDQAIEAYATDPAFRKNVGPSTAEQ